MTTSRFDVTALGNAIVDILARAEESDLVREGMVKGSMSLIDEARAEALYPAIGPTVLVSGGSAANTCAGVASLGGKAAFIGKVRNDALGVSFTHDIRAAGVHFTTAPAEEGPTTARCYILVTPDGERTMNTFLGASQHLGPDDVDPAIITDSQFIYLEGYLWDPPAAKLAFRRAAEIAHGAGRKVALSLSDSFCVGRYRAEFIELLRSGTVDVLFANEGEAMSLYETDDVVTALANLAKDAPVAVMTRSEKGAVVASGSSRVQVAAHPIERVVDATGAGDLFAAGFLTGLSRGSSHAEAARLGALCAAEILSHMGARPETSLKTLAAESGLFVAA
ncbi:adenosine kinase [Agaricicola taiwanensis]|uniref:Adenosine kinase n=1 Tax=Agaricicola taiwanensis TaxID=591372 RepID=A0A8J2VKI9_9RHOB|nr:adenosine kinase [Agaricicola taiwanensis]GGE29000.1 adenosine kinase [Agaricicola taiwanensis]